MFSFDIVVDLTLATSLKRKLRNGFLPENFVKLFDASFL